MLNYDKPSRIFPCILLTRNHMIFLVQFGINKHLLIFSKTTNCTRPTGSCNFVSLSKNLLVLIYSKLHSKSCDYLYKYSDRSFAHLQILLYLWVAIYVSNLIQRCEILVRFFVCFPLSAPEMISNVWNFGERTNRTTADVSWWRRGNWLFRCVAKLIKGMSG